MESFFALLQKNVLARRHRWGAREELRIEIVIWNAPTTDALGRLTPHRIRNDHDPTDGNAA
jgi:hypothetical protein